MSAMERTGIALALGLQCLVITALQVPLDPNIQRELPRPPTITLQSEKDYIVDPRDNIFIECEADGNPMPLFSWTRNGKFFNVVKDPRVSMRSHCGTLDIDFSTGGEPEEYQGEYQCFAHNQHGTALSNKILLRVSRAALWPSESLDPVVVEEGSPLVLQCNPPYGLPKPRLFWMNSSLMRTRQSKRVSQGLNGNLYFANVLQQDSKNDYICCARFSPTGTIQHKKPLTLKVLPTRRMTRRTPAFLVPSGTTSSKIVLRGEDLVLECIASGLPEPEIQWFKTGGELPSEKVKIEIFQKTMRLDSTSEEDSGEYCCQASNIMGSVRHCFSVAVYAAPYWLEEPKNLVLAPGENGQMVCRAIGNPKPTVQWLINGEHIDTAPSSHNLQVSDDILIFHEVQSGSSAVYQCNTSNVHGYLLANAFVSILDVPPRRLSPRNRFIRVTEFSRTILDCPFFGSPTPVLRWFKDSQSSSLDLGNYIFHVNGSLEISRTRKEDQGVYTCAASNTFGSSENQLTLEVKDMVDGREASPSEVSVYGLQRVPSGVSGPFEEDRFQPATRPNLLTMPDNVNSAALSLATYRNEPRSRPPSERSQTSEAPYSKSPVGFATRGWFISLMCTVALLIPILVIVCSLQRSRGGTYPVQEIEDLLKDPDDRNDKDGSIGQSDEDNKPKQGNQTSLDGAHNQRERSGSQLAYREGGDEQFQDERSFISQYTVENDTGKAEGNESSEATSQVNSVVDNHVANGDEAKGNEGSEATSRVNSVVDNHAADGDEAEGNESSDATSQANSVVDNHEANCVELHTTVEAESEPCVKEIKNICK